MAAPEEPSFFVKIANDVLQATESVSDAIDEGFELFFGKGIGTMTQQQQYRQQAASPNNNADEFVMTEEEMLMHEEFGIESPLQGIAESVLGDIMKKQSHPQTTMEHFEAFYSAITWSEPFIIGIIIFQVIMFLLCFWASRPQRGVASRISIMVIIAVLVKSAEYLNQLGNRHWESFATQNYFDKNGIFIAIFLCGPLILDSLMMLLLFVREASQLLVQVKKQELKRKKKKQQQDNNNNDNKNNATSEPTLKDSSSKKQD